jgi:hypothetical protein
MKLKLYYHMAPHQWWKVIADDKIGKMKECGLWDAFDQINICIHWDEEPFEEFKKELSLDNRVRFIYHPDSVKPCCEQYTNKTLKLEVDNDTESSYILRFHLKGITHYNTPNWPANNEINQLLDTHLIERWREVVAKLDEGYDAVGTYWVKQPWPHFKGNVWWATSDYIKRLKLLKMPHENNFQQQITGGGWIVHDAESWVGTSNPHAYDMFRETDQIGDHPDLKI